MQKQIPLKAVLRQPVRTLIFVLLVGLATFGFVARVVEHRLLSQEINRIETFYRTIGQLVPIDPMHNNLYPAAALIANSPLVQSHDIRTITQGIIHEAPNAIDGHYVNSYIPNLGGLLLQGQRGHAHIGVNVYDTIAIIRIRSISNRVYTVHTPTGYHRVPAVAMGLNIYNVLHGSSPFHPYRSYMVNFPLDENGNTPLDGLTVGGYYLANLNYHGLTPLGWPSFTVSVFPLFDDIYFVDAMDQEALNYARQRMAPDLAIMDANRHMLMVTGTQDMTALPFVQMGAVERFQGRFFSYEDYLNQNHVIVLPQAIDGLHRAARVGETITLTLRDMRTFVDGATPSPAFTHSAYWPNIQAGYWVGIPYHYMGDFLSYPTVQIQVEVIGTYIPSPLVSQPRWIGIEESFRSIEAFVPASIIPEGFGIVDAHLVSGQYSFVLHNPDDDLAFVARYGTALANLGARVEFLGEDPGNFLQSAIPIRNSININLLLFAIVFVVVLATTVFLYLRQRYKEFAIMRALGVPGHGATVQVLLPIALFWLPIAVGASIGAWFFALNQVADSLQILSEIATPLDESDLRPVMNILEMMRYQAYLIEVRLRPDINPMYLLWLCIAMAITWAGAVLVGTMVFAGKSMVSLLQGVNTAGGIMPTIKEVTPTQVRLSNMAMAIKREAKNKVPATIRHHQRHVLRAPVKYSLVLIMAFLFVLALGWLHHTITLTQAEIERLYATTIVTGHIVDPGAGLYGQVWGHNIPHKSLDIILNSGFVDNISLTQISNVQLHSLGEEVSPSVVLKAISNVDEFMYQATRPVAFGGGINASLVLDFAPGFDIHSLLLPHHPTPVLVHESIMAAYPFLYITGHIYIEGTPAIIIGTYTGGHPAITYRSGQPLVIAPLVEDAPLSHITFTVQQHLLPYMPQYLEDINQQLVYTITHEIIHNHQSFFRSERFNHSMVLEDAEFRTVVLPLEESLNLLNILYPTAQILSFVLSLGIGLLLMLQNAKNVAIIRVLGTPTQQARLRYLLEQMAVVALGVTLGAVAILVIGVSLGYGLMLAGIYTLGALIGTLAGVVIISAKTPLELLQVRE